VAVIDANLCNGCKVCLMYCPLGVIQMEGDKAVIDQTQCVECFVCTRKQVCAKHAILPADINSNGRELRHFLSDPTETKAATGVPGRGTEESKTNDVTGRVKKGQLGICIDMGRPGIGVWMRDAEKVAMALARIGLQFEEASPLTAVLKDKRTGEIIEQVRNERLLSIIVEGTVPEKDFGAVIAALRAVEKEIDTVFSLGVISRVDGRGQASFLSELDRLGLKAPVRGKVNVGLGRPLAQDNRG
jgi:NAD-dependent dihydropyrimidine dehydrogenase PreA subunit